jgi:arylsulfatase A-like enzyme
VRLGLALALVTGCTAEVQNTGHPDVLLVVMDTVRADRLHTFGHTRPTSNQLDAIAQAGVRFTDVTADGTWTWPGHASLFTGEPPWVHGAHWSEDKAVAGKVNAETGYWEVSPMREDLPTLAERFAGAGYRCVSLSANSLLAPALGLTRGFERAEWLKWDGAVVEAASGAMKASDPRPLFLTINLMAAHAPYGLVPEVPWSAGHAPALNPDTMPTWVAPYRMDRTPSALGLTERAQPGGLTGEEAYAKGELRLDETDLAMIRDLYDGELVRIDKALSQLIGDWNQSGRGQGVVLVTADHGEYLGEHGQIGHGFSVFREVTHVPLVIAAPGRLRRGQTVDTPVQLSDVFDTLLDLADLESSAPKSLVAVADGAARSGPIRAAAWPMADWAQKVGGRFTVGHRLYREADDVLLLDTTGAAALFHARDTAMMNDRSVSEPERTARLVALAQDAFPEAQSSGRIRVPDEALLQLKALGYTE